MARFKVGQRVRLIAYKPTDLREVPIAQEGVVVRIDDWVCVDFGGAYGPRKCVESQLAPLTDPGADEFIQSMERFAKERELLEVRGGAA